MAPSDMGWCAEGGVGPFYEDFAGTGPDENRAGVLEHLSELAELGIEHAMLSPRRPWDEPTLDWVAAMGPDAHAMGTGG